MQPARFREGEPLEVDDAKGKGRLELEVRAVEQHGPIVGADRLDQLVFVPWRPARAGESAE